MTSAIVGIFLNHDDDDSIEIKNHRIYSCSCFSCAIRHINTLIIIDEKKLINNNYNIQTYGRLTHMPSFLVFVPTQCQIPLY